MKSKMKFQFVIAVIIFGFSIPTKAQTDIRKIDFKNFTYNLSCSPNDKSSIVKIENGKFIGDKNGEKTFINIIDVKFGDLNFDRKNDAVVKYGCGSGASGYFTRGLLFTIKNKKLTVLSLIEGGDKGDGGISKMKIVKNLLVVKRYELPTAGSPCCPAFIETTKYKLKRKKLVRVGKQTLRKISKSDQI